LFLLGASSCFLDFVQHHVRSCNCADQKTRSIIDPGFQNCVYTAFLKKDNSAMCTGLSPGTASFPLLSCMHASSITNVTSGLPPSVSMRIFILFYATSPCPAALVLAAVVRSMGSIRSISHPQHCAIHGRMACRLSHVLSSSWNQLKSDCCTDG
jgi:hypothetical protein